MLQSLLLIALFLVSLPGQARTIYRPSFYDRALARIQTPALERTTIAGQPEGTSGESPFSAAPAPLPNRPVYLHSIPRGSEPARKNLAPVGILLTAIGGAGIALGAASLHNDSGENAVSISLIVSSAILALIGVWVIIAGTSK